MEPTNKQSTDRAGLDPRSGRGADRQGREGGDDALAESSPSDNRSDEKVIVNEQREQKTVNAPSQSAAYTSEDNGSEEDIIN